MRIMGSVSIVVRNTVCREKKKGFELCLRFQSRNLQYFNTTYLFNLQKPTIFMELQESQLLQQ